MSDKIPNYLPSTLETIDSALLEYVQNLNLFVTTGNGFEKVPVIWSSAERSFQIKDNKEIRDKNGSLIAPIISISRISAVKDPNKKGIFQAGLSPNQERILYTEELNQQKTSNFANADSLKKTGQINFKTSKNNKKKVYKSKYIPIPIYITVEYKINILTNYQSQMNEIIQPFMSRVVQNYFLIEKDGYRYESFINQEFNQENINLDENERKYKSSITIKVLGYLIGEGNNQEKPQVLTKENPVEIKFPKENLFLIEEEKQTARKKPSNQGSQVSSSILMKKVFLIGDGVNSIYNISHNLNSRDVIITVRQNEYPYTSTDLINIEHTDLNNISVDMSEIIGVDSYAVIILG